MSLVNKYIGYDDKKLTGYAVTLVFILFIKIMGFATIIESAGIAKVLKLVMGLFATGMTFRLYGKLRKNGYIASFDMRNSFVLYLYVAYLLMGGISLTYANDTPFAIIQLIRDVDLLIFAIYFTRVIKMINFFHPEKGLRFTALMCWGIFFNTMYFLIGYFVAEETFMRLTHGGDVARLGGFIMNPNELGMLANCGNATVFLELPFRKHKWLYLVVFGLNSYVLVLTGSRSSMIATFLVILYCISKSSNQKLKAVVLAGCLIVGPIAAKEIVFDEDKGGAEEVMSMTGRLPFWKALLGEALPKEPYFGYGFMNIYYTKKFQGKNTYPASMTHNTFVQVVMNLGLVGFLLVLLQMSVVFRAVRRSTNREYKMAFTGIFIPIFINSLTEFGIWGETNYGVLFWQMIWLLFVVYYNPNYNEKEKVIARRYLGTDEPNYCSVDCKDRFLS